MLNMNGSVFSNSNNVNKSNGGSRTKGAGGLAAAGVAVTPEIIRQLPKVPPQKNPDESSSDAALAWSMNELSVEERDRALDDVNCVGDPSAAAPHEEMERNDPSMVEESLRSLDWEIERVPDRHAYDLAVSMDRGYATDRSFRLLFLRADGYDARHAATRIVMYFEHKLEIFGEEKLVKDITQDDLDESDLRCLYDGRYYQICSLRDRAGRPIFFARASSDTVMNKLRTTWYLYHQFLFDDIVQRIGVVIILYAVMGGSGSGGGRGKGEKAPKPRRPDRGAMWRLFKVSQSIPVRWGALHFCFDKPVIKGLVNLAITMLEPKSKARTRANCGSHFEIVHNLMGFGISPDSLPVRLDGTEDSSGHVNFLNQLRTQEVQQSLRRQRQQKQQQQRHTWSGGSDSALTTELQARASSLWSSASETMTEAGSYRTNSPSSQTPVVAARPKPVTKRKKKKNTGETQKWAIPGPFDILLGKGRPLGRHQGNVYFRRVIEVHAEDYDKLNRVDKTTLAETLVQQIKASGVRFLQKNDAGMWYEVADDAARTKVSHTFRNRRLLSSAPSGKTSSSAAGPAAAPSAPTDQPAPCGMFNVSGPAFSMSSGPMVVGNANVVVPSQTCGGCFGGTPFS